MPAGVRQAVRVREASHDEPRHAGPRGQGRLKRVRILYRAYNLERDTDAGVRSDVTNRSSTSSAWTVANTFPSIPRGSRTCISAVRRRVVGLATFLSSDMPDRLLFNCTLGQPPHAQEFEASSLNAQASRLLLIRPMDSLSLIVVLPLSDESVSTTDHAFCTHIHELRLPRLHPNVSLCITDQLLTRRSVSPCALAQAD